MKPIPRPGEPRYEYLMAKHGFTPRLKTYTAKRAQAQFARMLADVAAGCVVEITHRGKAVASVLRPAKLETLEMGADPNAMRADQHGKLKSRQLPEPEAELTLPRRKLSLVEHMRKFKGVEMPAWLTDPIHPKPAARKPGK